MIKVDERFDPKPCCVHLRCKSMYYQADERPGKLHVEDEMGYWCGHTNADLGPDGKVTLHHTCQQGRGCYEAGPEV